MKRFIFFLFLITYANSFAEALYTVKKNVPTDFYSTSKGNIDSFEWIFPGGEVINGERIQYTFTKSGRQQVTLKVKSKDGSIDQKTKDILVINNGKPTASIEIKLDGKIISGNRVSFKRDQKLEINSVSINSLGKPENLESLWSIDGKEYTEGDLYKQFDKSKPYILTLQVHEKEDPSLTSQDTFTLTLENENPIIHEFVYEKSPKVRGQVHLKTRAEDIDGEIVSYKFEAIDGGKTLISQFSKVPETYMDLGVYPGEHEYYFRVTVLDDKSGKETKDHPDPFFFKKSLNNNPPEVKLSAIPGNTGSLDTEFTFLAEASDIDKDFLNYEWNLEEGVLLEGKEIKHKYSTPGEKVVRIMVSDGLNFVEKKFKVFVLGENDEENILLEAAQRQELYENGQGNIIEEGQEIYRDSQGNIMQEGQEVYKDAQGNILQRSAQGQKGGIFSNGEKEDSFFSFPQKDSAVCLESVNLSPQARDTDQQVIDFLRLSKSVSEGEENPLDISNLSLSYASLKLAKKGEAIESQDLKSQAQILKTLKQPKINNQNTINQIIESLEKKKEKKVIPEEKIKIIDKIIFILSKSEDLGIDRTNTIQESYQKIYDLYQNHEDQNQTKWKQIAAFKNLIEKLYVPKDKIFRTFGSLYEIEDEVRKKQVKVIENNVKKIIAQEFEEDLENYYQGLIKKLKRTDNNHPLLKPLEDLDLEFIAHWGLSKINQFQMLMSDMIVFSHSKILLYGAKSKEEHASEDFYWELDNGKSFNQRDVSFYYRDYGFYKPQVTVSEGLTKRINSLKIKVIPKCK